MGKHKADEKFRAVDINERGELVAADDGSPLPDFLTTCVDNPLLAALRSEKILKADPAPLDQVNLLRKLASPTSSPDELPRMSDEVERLGFDAPGIDREAWFELARVVDFRPDCLPFGKVSDEQQILNAVKAWVASEKSKAARERVRARLAGQANDPIGKGDESGEQKRRPRRSDDEWDNSLIEFESDQEDRPSLTESEWAVENDLKPNTVNVAFNKARDRRDVAKAAIAKNSRERSKARPLD
jgi:hypothetical protein